MPVRTAITPVAAVCPAPRVDRPGPSVIPIQRAPASFHVAAATISAAAPDGRERAWDANGHSENRAGCLPQRRDGSCRPGGCGVSWNWLPGIGRIESGHAGGGAPSSSRHRDQPDPSPARPDGTLPGNEVIVQQSVGSRRHLRLVMGPMQFLPGTWARYASDGDGDGIADPQNLFDSYPVGGPIPVQRRAQPARPPGEATAAILRYNNSVAYAAERAGLAAAYATGVVPVDLPPITGPLPPDRRRLLGAPGGSRAQPAAEPHRPARTTRSAAAGCVDRPRPAKLNSSAPNPAVPVDGASQTTPGGPHR